MRQPQSVTGRFLANPLRHPLHPPRAVNKQQTPKLSIENTTLHNLKHLDVRLPLQRLVVITGVSGSGKSTLARDVLHANLVQQIAARRTHKQRPLAGCAALRGADGIGRVLEVDQTPIGKTPRSCPATYVGFWDAIRRLFAATTEARMRGYTASRFSFNTKGGRCEACEGQGMREIEMSFLPDVKVPARCAAGARFNAETLAVRWQGQVHRRRARDGAWTRRWILRRASPPSTTRSRCCNRWAWVISRWASKARRCPAAKRSASSSSPNCPRCAPTAAAAARPGRAGSNKETLYVLDEPTVGLHMADVEKLIRVLHRLVDAGNTVVVIEHNLELIAEADWIIDLGPEGGDAGGRIVAAGVPADIVRKPGGSHTAQVLAPFLAGRSLQT